MSTIEGGFREQVCTSVESYLLFTGENNPPPGTERDSTHSIHAPYFIKSVQRQDTHAQAAQKERSAMSFASIPQSGPTLELTRREALREAFNPRG